MLKNLNGQVGKIEEISPDIGEKKNKNDVEIRNKKKIRELSRQSNIWLLGVCKARTDKMEKNFFKGV